MLYHETGHLKKKNNRKEKQMAILKATYEKHVPFHDLDPMSVVWHGNYVAYMEEAREVFLAKYAMRNFQAGGSGYITPVTHLDIKYIKSFTYDDTVVVEVTYKPCRAARIELEYRFYRKSDGALMTEATSSHHFVDTATGELQYSRPPLYKEWQEKWKVFETEENAN